MRRSRRASVSPSTTAPSVDAADAELLQRYVDAFERYDMDALTSLIHEDATQSMPPFDMWLAGRDDILSWWVGPGTRAGARASSPWSRRTARLLSASTSRADGEGYEPWALQVIEIENGRIVELTFFLETEKLFPRFGLPLEFPA